MKQILSIAVILLTLFVGCQEQSSIVSPVSDNTNLTGGRLSKNIHSSEPFLVTEKHGGVGKLVYQNGDATVSVMLKFQAHSVVNDIWVSITLDDEDLVGGINLEFGPHGNTFLKPAILDITAVGISSNLLTSLNSVWYMDENGNLLEKINYEKLIVQIERGAIKLMQAEIPHFSRYGFIRKEEE